MDKGIGRSQPSLSPLTEEAGDGNRFGDGEKVHFTIFALVGGIHVREVMMRRSHFQMRHSLTDLRGGGGQIVIPRGSCRRPHGNAFTDRGGTPLRGTPVCRGAANEWQQQNHMPQ